MRKMSRVLMQVGLTAAGTVLLPLLVCAQATDAVAPQAEVKVEAKKKTPTSFFGVDTKAGDKDAPERETIITADKIDFDNKEGIILFDENVLIDDAQFFMRSERLIVFMEGTNDVSQIMAIGNVNITNELRHATCAKAVYTKKDAQIVMLADENDKDSVVRMVTQGDTAGTVTGYKVTIWLDDEKVLVEHRKGEQAKVTLPSLSTLNRGTGGDKKLP